MPRRRRRTMLPPLPLLTPRRLLRRRRALPARPPIRRSSKWALDGEHSLWGRKLHELPSCLGQRHCVYVLLLMHVYIVGYTCMTSSKYMYEYSCDILIHTPYYFYSWAIFHSTEYLIPKHDDPKIKKGALRPLNLDPSHQDSGIRP